MKVVAWDTETQRFRPGMMAPELACLSYRVLTAGVRWDAQLADPAEGCALMHKWLEEPHTVLVGHHVCYDVAVMMHHDASLIPKFFAAYDADRVTDTKLREQLLRNASGELKGYLHKGEWRRSTYTLDDISARYRGKRLDKGADSWRKRYGSLMHRPLAEWPADAVEYPKEDAVATLAGWEAQEVHADPYLVNQYEQARAALALHLMHVWGLRTYRDGVEQLKSATEARRAEVWDRLLKAGLVRADGSRDTKKAKAHMRKVCEESGIEVKLTESGAKGNPEGVCLDEDACKASGDSLLQDYARFSTLGSVLSKDIPLLMSGTITPVHSNFGLAESGRVTSSKPNIQNFRALPGVREAFVPREGWVFAQADFDQLELRTLAQVCVTRFGVSKLAEALNAGLDPHTMVAAQIRGSSYEVAAREVKREKKIVLSSSATQEEKAALKPFTVARDTAKVANFGFPGGLGYASLVEYAWAGFKQRLTEADARRLKAIWVETWPEMRLFFKRIADACQSGGGTMVVEQLFSRRLRGGCRFTQACNSEFQGLGSDAAKSALWRVSSECYSVPGSALFGCRPVAFVHDEIITEVMWRPTELRRTIVDAGTKAEREIAVPYDPKAEAAAARMVELMVEGANVYLPDVPAKTEAVLMSMWSKNASVVKATTGELLAWPPKEAA